MWKNVFVPFIYLICIAALIASTVSAVNIHIGKTWTVINRLTTTYKSCLFDKIKQKFFQAASVSVLSYGCTTFTLRKNIKNKKREKKQGTNYIRMLRVGLNKFWKQHSPKQQLYSPSISQTTQVRLARYAGHCWRSNDKLISDILFWTLTHGHTSIGRPTRTYIHRLCADTGCRQDRWPIGTDEKRERERERERRREREKEREREGERERESWDTVWSAHLDEDHDDDNSHYFMSVTHETVDLKYQPWIDFCLNLSELQ